MRSQTLAETGCGPIQANFKRFFFSIQLTETLRRLCEMNRWGDLAIGDSRC